MSVRRHVILFRDLKNALGFFLGMTSAVPRKGKHEGAQHTNVLETQVLVFGRRTRRRDMAHPRWIRFRPRRQSLSFGELSLLLPVRGSEAQGHEKNTVLSRLQDCVG